MITAAAASSIPLVPVKNPVRGASLLDWSAVEAALNSDDYKSGSRGRSFLLLALHTYFGILPAFADEYITDGGNDRGIDAVVIDEGNQTLDLVTAKSINKFETSKKTFPGGEIDKILTFVDELLDKNDALLTTTNPSLRSKVEAIWEYLQNGNRFDICVHVYSNMSDTAHHDRERLRTALQFRGITLREAHLPDLSDGLAHNFDPPPSRILKLLDQQRFECVHGGVRMVIGNCLLSEIAQFVANPDSKSQLDRRLLHQNVRGVLEGAQPIHEAIKGTLSSNKIQWFPYLNNGITIVCDNIKTQAGGNFPLHLDRPQIVNGAQTVSCIRDVAAAEAPGFDKAVVTVKIIENRERSLREEIAVATNSQARVYSRDLRANEDIAKKLSAGIERLGYFYKRRRGDANSMRVDRIIDAARLGQIIFATALDSPTLAKTNSNEIFGPYFGRIFNPASITPEAAIALHNFDQVTRRFRDQLVSEITVAKDVMFFESWATEGVFHLMWLAYHKASGDDITTKCANAAKKLEWAAQVIDRYYSELERPSAYRIFRSVSSVSDLRRRAQLSKKDQSQLSLFDWGESQS